MKQITGQAVASLSLAVGLTLAAAPMSSAEPTGPERASSERASSQQAGSERALPASMGAVKVTPFRFSPNGDGRRDVAKVRYTLPRRTSAVLLVTDTSHTFVMRRVKLPAQAAGTHVWKWDGRRGNGDVITDQMLHVHLLLPGKGVGDKHPVSRVKIDTAMQISLDSTSWFSSDRKAPLKVWPRTRVVTDAVALNADTLDYKVRKLRLVIRDRKGRRVLSRNIDKPLFNDGGYLYGRGEDFAWTARKGGTLTGKPLPSGRYRVRVHGEDLAGNRARSKVLRVWVSRDRLVWAEKSFTLPAALGQVPTVNARGTNARGGDDYTPCGVTVPSEIYPGGWSLRSAICPPSKLWGTSHALQRWHVEAPGADGVRGVQALRVAWTGTPTNAGETDVAELFVPGEEQEGPTTVAADPEAGYTTSSSTGAQTPWLHAPGTIDAQWTMITEDDNWVDVKEFTVDMKWLVVAP
jgi:hypothetical protein